MCSGHEWLWRFEFETPADAVLRCELWSFDSIFGHALLAQGLLDVSTVQLDASAAVTRTEVIGYIH
jgi:hypothetical protein